MTDFNIPVQSYASLDISTKSNKKMSIFKALYVGESGTPSYEEEVSFDDLIQDFIATHSIPSSPLSLRLEYKEEIMSGLEALAGAIEKAKKAVNEMPMWEQS